MGSYAGRALASPLNWRLLMKINVYWQSLKNSAYWQSIVGVVVSVVEKWPLLAIAMLLLYPWHELPGLLFICGLAVLLTFMTHVIRKLLMPRADMQAILEEAMRGSLPASLVFMAMAFILSTFVMVMAWLFKG